MILLCVTRRAAVTPKTAASAKLLLLHLLLHSCRRAASPAGRKLPANLLALSPLQQQQSGHQQ
jgi:hypothetical protein